ncbi:MAG: helicase RepA family protein [Betaproteobacteria bacterium]|nr:helicase RepA family protein [Betaproteobacteria bacterium]
MSPAKRTPPPPPAPALPWAALNIAHCMFAPPPALDFVIPGLVAGTVGSIVAPGATGKSWLALQIAAQVATGADTLDLGPVPQGRVLYLAAEDPADVLHARVHTLAQVLNPAQREALAGQLFVLPTLGQTGDLLDDGQTAAKVAAAAEGCRLVVLDTLSRWHCGDENDRSDAARVMRTLERICDSTGATVLFLHHTNKSAALEGNGDKQQASRGSSVFVDDARFVMTMTTCTEAEARDFGIDDAMRSFFVKLTFAKCNYVPPQRGLWLRKRDGGRLEQVPMFKQPKRQVRKGGEDDF